MIEEIWKKIPGCDNYKISNLGRVKSSIKNIEKILKNNKGKNGYLRVNLGRKNLHNIHRLVAEAFIQNKEKKPCVNHKDGDKLNNEVANLEWCSYYENNRHAAKNGLWKPQLQNLKPRKKLTGQY